MKSFTISNGHVKSFTISQTNKLQSQIESIKSTSNKSFTPYAFIYRKDCPPDEREPEQHRPS